MFRPYRDKNGPAVRRILSAGQWTLIHRRQDRGVLREVLLTADGNVLKRYTYDRAPPWFGRAWAREFRALKRLDGRGAPGVVGYVGEVTGQGPRMILVRRFVPGNPVGELDKALATDIAALLAGFHDAGVTTDDAHLGNFVERQDGSLAFLDFGRSRTFSRWNPLLLAGIALDLHRFQRAAVKNETQIWTHFLEEYFRLCPFGPIRRHMIRRLIAFDMWRYRLVKGSAPVQA